MMMKTAKVARSESTPRADQVKTSPWRSSTGSSTALSVIPEPIPAKVMPLTRPFWAGGARPTTAAAISTIKQAAGNP